FSPRARDNPAPTHRAPPGSRQARAPRRATSARWARSCHQYRETYASPNPPLSVMRAQKRVEDALCPAMTTFTVLRSFHDNLARLDRRTPGFEILADQLAHLLWRAGERISLQREDARPQLALLESLPDRLR